MFYMSGWMHRCRVLTRLVRDEIYDLAIDIDEALADGTFYEQEASPWMVRGEGGGFNNTSDGGGGENG